MTEIIFHLLIFAAAAISIFIFGGVLVRSTDVLAHRLRQDGFIVAFVLLGTLTSISELSVAVNSTLEKTPAISAGNLIGASFVLFLFIIPFLAIAGGGFSTQNTLPSRLRAFALLVIGLPALFLFDGVLRPIEGIIMIAMYLLLVYNTKKVRSHGISESIKSLSSSKSKLRYDVLKLAIAATTIFISGHFLVTETIFFSAILNLPPSFMGLIVISIGTNLPELVVGIRAIAQKKKSIAFGDYIGSAAFNTFLLGLLSVWNGEFYLERNEFLLASIFLIPGLIFFYFFSRSKHFISRTEGFLLFCVYVAFVVTQFFVASQLSTTF